MASRMQVPPNSDLTLGMICIDKSVPGRCTWQMTADERFANPAGIMQGGFLGAFADSSMGAAAVTFVGARRVFAANAELKISFNLGEMRAETVFGVRDTLAIFIERLGGWIVSRFRTCDIAAFVEWKRV